MRPARRHGAVRRKLGSVFRSGAVVLSVLSVLVGIGVAAGYASVVDYTNSPDYCAHGCHEMESTVFREYAHSKHFSNEQGVVVSCAQCHVPQDNWGHTLRYKLAAASELWSHFADREYDSRRFEARRPALSQKVLDGYAATNARECKACHQYANMILADQAPEAHAEHVAAMKTDANCLDCHRGVAHKRVDQPARFDIK